MHGLKLLVLRQIRNLFSLGNIGFYSRFQSIINKNSQLRSFAVFSKVVVFVIFLLKHHLQFWVKAWWSIQQGWQSPHLAG